MPSSKPLRFRKRNSANSYTAEFQAIVAYLGTLNLLNRRFPLGLVPLLCISQKLLGSDLNWSRITVLDLRDECSRMEAYSVTSSSRHSFYELRMISILRSHRPFGGVGVSASLYRSAWCVSSQCTRRRREIGFWIECST